MLFISIPFLIDPSDGYAFIMIMLGFVFTFRGIKLLVYYITMARYMVGGSRVLFSGLLKITDADAFWKSYTCGIGPGKAYGLGMLTVANG